jgi:hypothetical protein
MLHPITLIVPDHAMKVAPVFDSNLYRFSLTDLISIVQQWLRTNEIFRLFTNVKVCV